MLVAWSWQWWHEGRGLWGCGLWVLWHGFLLGCRVVRWLWRGGGVVTGHGSIWVVGCKQGIDVDGAWCVAGNSSLCLFFHSPILSLLYFSHFDSVSQIGFWFWLDLERDLSDSLKASQCRVKHNLLWRIKEKETVATVAFKVVAVETNGRTKEKVRMREKEEKRRK